MEILSAVFAGTVTAALLVLAGIQKIRAIRAKKNTGAACGSCRGCPLASHCRKQASETEEKE